MSDNENKQIIHHNGVIDKNISELFARVAVLGEQAIRFQELMVLSDRAVTTAMAASDRAVSAAMAASDRAISTAMAASEKAVLKAESAADRRFESVNEFRNTLADQQSTFARMGEIDIRFKSLEEKLNIAIKSLEERFNLINITQTSSKGWLSGAHAAWIFIIGVIGLVVFLITHFSK